jgi:membrane protein implicated in regulation of membrane protease activity
MQTLYWACFLIGGSFIVLSLVGGHDLDHSFEADWDHGFEVETDPDLELYDPQDSAPPPRNPWVRVRSPRRGEFSLWSILLSVKFWTFLSGFFGLTGLVLGQVQPDLAPLTVALLALLVGLMLGAAASTILQLLRRRTRNSLVRSQDLVGLVGLVELPLSVGSCGKVQLQVKGTQLSLIAQTQDPTPLEKGQRVLVVGTEGSRIWVVADAGLAE